MLERGSAKFSIPPPLRILSGIEQACTIGLSTVISVSTFLHRCRNKSLEMGVYIDNCPSSIADSVYINREIKALCLGYSLHNES